MQVCDINNANCDSTDVFFKFCGRGYFGSCYCNSAQSGVASYGGNYGLCHNGVSTQYFASSLFGDRDEYNENKLHTYATAAAFSERIFARVAAGPPDVLFPSCKELYLSDITRPSGVYVVHPSDAVGDIEGPTARPHGLFFSSALPCIGVLGRCCLSPADN